MTLPKPQFVKDNSGKNVAVVFSMDQYEKILEELEELDDIKEYEKAKKSDNGKRIALSDYITKRKAKNG